MKKISYLIMLALLSTTIATGCNRKSAENTIRVEGSDTMVNLAISWSENYCKENPGLQIPVGGEGSGTGIKALIDGQAEIANCSREMKQKELDLLKEKHNGKEAVKYTVAKDALAVFVHIDNPLDEISIDELTAIYSEGGAVNHWSDLKRTGKSLPIGKIVVLNRNRSSGTFGYFKKRAVQGKEYRTSTLNQGASKDIVNYISTNKLAIGYAGMAYHVEGKVKMLKIREKEGYKAYPPSLTTARDGTYPITRGLYCYTIGEAEGEVKEYLDWIMSKPGQEIVKIIGYIPIIELDK